MALSGGSVGEDTALLGVLVAEDSAGETYLTPRSPGARWTPSSSFCSASVTGKPPSRPSKASEQSGLTTSTTGEILRSYNVLH